MNEKLKLTILILLGIIIISVATDKVIDYKVNKRYLQRQKQVQEYREKLIKEQEPITSVDGRILFSSSGRIKETTLFLLKNGDIEPVNLSSNKLSDYSKLEAKGLTRIVIRDRNGVPQKEVLVPQSYTILSFDVLPNGKLIVFSALVDGEEGSNLYTIDINGNNLKQITFFPSTRWGVLNPKFSPNGKIITFEASKNPDLSKAPTGIYTINIDGSSQRELTGDRFPGGIQPSWSPDGKRIIFVSSNEIDGTRYRNLYMTDVSGSWFKRITNHKRFDSNPCFSPDGNMIVYASSLFEPMLGSNLFVINADGTDNRRLTPIQFLDRYPYVVTDDNPVWRD